ncbi:hypothetical protein AABB24_017305, partial [Solanum stoloniferum]
TIPPPLYQRLPLAKNVTRRQTKSQRKSRCKLKNFAQPPCKTHTLAVSMSTFTSSLPPFFTECSFLPIPFTVGLEKKQRKFQIFLSKIQRISPLNRSIFPYK